MIGRRRYPAGVSTRIDDCGVIDLPRVDRDVGSITPIEASRDVPFPIARVYYLYDVPGGVDRGGHAHIALQQLIVSALGSFDVIVDDGFSRKTFSLNRAYVGLYVPPGIWRELKNFSSGAICLVLASLPFDETDYIRDYADFLRRKKSS